jgi:hypothetical protein
MRRSWLGGLFYLACIFAGCRILSGLTGVHVNFTTVAAIAALHVAIGMAVRKRVTALATTPARNTSQIGEG